MKKTIWIIGISFILGLLVSGYIFVSHHETNAAPDKAAFKPAASVPSVAAPLFALDAPEIKTNLDFVTIADKIGATVVKIEALRVEKRQVFGPDLDSPFEDFWDRFFGQPAPREQQAETTVIGTGFFISADGYVLTNNHIVENATKITVSLAGGEDYLAKTVGTDVRTDLALIKVEAKDLPYAELGDSAALKVGEWVLAFGNPLGMEHTVTAGIVSAKGRQLGFGEGSSRNYEDFIQTDAAINRGNSGGPLVNMKGEVVGINSNILTPTGGNIGIGFAIPTSLAMKVIPQLKEKGRVVRSKLGVTIGSVNEDIRKILNLKDRTGALVNHVVPGDPADKAGLKQYDVITGINGQTIKDNNDLRFKIADFPPGTKIRLNIIRDGKEITITATTVEMDPQEDRIKPEKAPRDIGVSVAKMTANLARRYGYRSVEGLIITEVRNGSPAAKAGLQAGDIIIEANRKKVDSPSEFDRILQNTKSGDAVMLLIRRETDGESQDAIVIVKVP